MEDLTGKQLGPYQIVTPLGEGGMAAVYKAYQAAMERYVALKILPRHFADDPQFVARFEREAKLVAQLQHPHILPVFDYGQAEGYTYIVMPFVQGGTLTASLTGQPLPLSRIRQVISQVGDALDYAHARGMIHRDVKPSNVLIDERGNCLLTDFGLARIVEGSTDLTTSGTVMGTPAYMSPEQGSGKKVGPRSDVYSLGIILYEMATGRVPFTAETPVAVIIKHIQDPLPPARSLNPALPEGVERVILKALSKSPEDRFRSAGELVSAIQAATPDILAPVDVGEKPASPAAVESTSTLEYPQIKMQGPTPKVGPARTRSPWFWALIGTVSLFAIIGGFLALLPLASPIQTPSQPSQVLPVVATAPLQVGATQYAPTHAPSVNPVQGPTIAATEYSVATPSPSELNSGTLLFQEDFDGNENRWPTGHDGGDTYYMDGGEYHIIASERTASSVYWLTPANRPDQGFADFYLEAKARLIEGTQTDDTYGVLFRYSDDRGPYIAMVSQAQQNYSVHDADQTILWWTYSPKVFADGANTIGVLCKGDSITIYINGTQVDSTQSDFSRSGGIGLVYANSEHIAFDYIYVWALP